MRSIEERARNIRCAVFDVDGVMTDCKLYLGPNGMEWKVVNVRDGYGLKMLMKAGIEVAVISGRPSEPMRARLAELGVKRVWLDCDEKLVAWEELRDSLGLKDEQMAMMGDDVPDIALMKRCGLALTVADAHPRAAAVAHWTSRLPGGAGAVREAADLIVAAQGKLG